MGARQAKDSLNPSYPSKCEWSLLAPNFCHSSWLPYSCIYFPMVTRWLPQSQTAQRNAGIPSRRKKGAGGERTFPEKGKLPYRPSEKFGSLGKEAGKMNVGQRGME